MFSKIGLRAVGALLATSVAGVTSVIAASGANAWDPTVWDRVAACESSNRWDINTGNGYYGGLQFSHSTWAAYGGQAYAAEAHLATKAQQIAIARRTLYGQGPRAWPVCSVKAGLTKENGGADPKAMPDGSSATTAPPASSGSSGSGSSGSSGSSDAVAYSKVKLAVDGVLGPLTIAEMQKWSGSTPDGIWGPKTSRALQTKVGAQVTGVRDTQTTVKVQGVVGVSQDGVWGRQTTSGLQRYLNAR